MQQFIHYSWSKNWLKTKVIPDILISINRLWCLFTPQQEAVEDKGFISKMKQLTVESIKKFMGTSWFKYLLLFISLSIVIYLCFTGFQFTTSEHDLSANLEIVTPKFNYDTMIVTQSKYNDSSTTHTVYKDLYSASSTVDPNSFKFYIHKNTNFLQQSAYYSQKKIKINPENYQYLIQPRNFCKTNPFLIILVPSIHTNKMVRDSIRRTWGSQDWPSGRLDNVKLLFLFGVHQHQEMEFIIQEEGEIFNDIVQGDYLDSYYNLTVKILNGIRWVSRECIGINYILKADEDTFTNIPLLLEFLQTSGMPETVYGHLHVDSNVKRVGKWAVSKSDFPFPTYPDYMAGNTYVISGDILSKLVQTSEYVKYMNIEDVYITGILVRILKITHIDVEGFTQWFSSKPSVCDILKKHIITGNNIDIQYTQTIWDALNNNSFTHC